MTETSACTCKTICTNARRYSGHDYCQWCRDHLPDREHCPNNPDDETVSEYAHRKQRRTGDARTLRSPLGDFDG